MNIPEVYNLLLSAVAIYCLTYFYTTGFLRKELPRIDGQDIFFLVVFTILVTRLIFLPISQG